MFEDDRHHPNPPERQPDRTAPLAADLFGREGRVAWPKPKPAARRIDPAILRSYEAR